MSPLERRYKVLLLAYPAWYRRERGAEILTTLLDASPPGAAWPSARDAISLLMGGLKIRTGQNRRLGMSASIRTAVLLGVVLSLEPYVAPELSSTLRLLPGTIAGTPGRVPMAVCCLATMAVMAAAWFAPRPVAVALGMTAAGLRVFWADAGDPADYVRAAALLMVLALLVRDTERMPRSWLWLAGSFLALQFLFWSTQVAQVNVIYTYGLIAEFTVAAAALAWAVVDARPALAVAVFVTCQFVLPIVFDPLDRGANPAYQATLIPVGITAAIVVPAIWRLRRQIAL
jgi:hypothetical protein